MRSPLLQSLALAAVVGLSIGCGADSAELTDPPGPPVVTDRFTCDDGGTCSVDLASRGGFKVVITSTSCKATDNKLELSSPVNTVLSSNGCSLKSGDSWEFAGPYEAGTPIVMQVTSAKLAFDPQLLVTQTATGNFPSWHVRFEDGGDHDNDDIEFDIITTPPAE